MPLLIGSWFAANDDKSQARSPHELDDEECAASSSLSPGPANSGWLWSAAVAVGVVVLVVAVAGVKSWSDLRMSQITADRLGQELARVDQSVGRLQQRIHLLQSNSELLERVAREELGVVRPDEIVIILPEP